MIQRFLPKKIWLINRDFQLRYTGAGLLAGVFSTIITSILILYPLFAFKIITVGMFLPWPVFACIISAAVLNGMAQLAFGIILTHKIAGPMFSLIRHLRQIGAGHWHIQMRQRRGDDLQMIVRHLNEMSLSLVHTVQTDLSALAKIKEQILKNSGDSDNLRSVLTDLETLSNTMRARIGTNKDGSI